MTNFAPDAVSPANPEVKYGEREIAEGKLITFPNPRIGRRYDINITLPEFTCKCPFSGYPDFATIYITYIPDEKVVELKAKIDLVMTGGLDTEINELYEKTEQTLKEKKEETEKKTKLMKEYEESSMKIGKVFYSSEKDEERRTFNNERYMGKQYDRFLDISGTLPDYISRNLETMPNK